MKDVTYFELIEPNGRFYVLKNNTVRYPAEEMEDYAMAHDISIHELLKKLERME